MTPDWLVELLPPHGPVLALPGPGNPRLLFRGDSPAERWRRTRLYPAFRPAAKLARLGLRLGAAVGLARPHRREATDWLLEPVVQELWPGARSVVVLVGTPGPAQKIVAEIWGDVVVGYVKLAKTRGGRRRVRREADVLRMLPTGLGPRLLAVPVMTDLDAIALDATPGRAPVREDRSRIEAFLASLVRDEAEPVDTHPWVREVRDRLPAGGEEWLARLGTKPWPVVWSHGDFAPWNLRVDAAGRVRAIDWEYGAPCGFPGLDRAHYDLQVAALLRNDPPARAARQVASDLQRSGWSRGQAASAVALAAWLGYDHGRKDGLTDDAVLQRWRRSVWESVT